MLINDGKNQLDVLNKIMENLKINDSPAAGKVRMQVHTLNNAMDPSEPSNPPDVDVDPDILYNQVD